MPETSTLALFAVAAVTLLVIPGPAVLYIVTRSVDQGRAAGLASVCGVHVGTLVHVAAAALGLSALLVSSATAYDTVRWLGAAYLVWLGVRRLLARDEDVPEAAAGPDARRLGLRPHLRPGRGRQRPQPQDGPVLLRLPAPVRRHLPGLGAVPGGRARGRLRAPRPAQRRRLRHAASTGAGWLRRRPGVARASRLVSGGVLISLGVTTALAGSRSSSAQ